MTNLDAKKYDLIAALPGPTAGLAVEPGGESFWTCSGATGPTVEVYQIKTADNTKSATVKLSKAGGHKASGEYIALQTESGVVKQVWVSTYGNGDDKLFYFDPTKVTGNITTAATGLPEGSLRDVLWDETRKLLWITIDDIGLEAVSPTTHGVDASYSVNAPQIRRLALSMAGGKSRVWFAFKTGNEYQISFYDPDNKKKRMDIQDARLNSEPYSLVASKDGKTIWLVTLSGDLWKIRNADGDVSGMTLESACAFGRTAKQILCDSHGYLWVTLPASGDHTTSALAECLPEGELKGIYELSKTKSAYDIAYVSTSTVPDTFYLTDSGVLDMNIGAASFRPADWVDPAVVSTLSLTGSADIDAEHNTEFAAWVLAVKENGGDLKHDIQLDLLVSDPVNGAFEVVKGDKLHLDSVCQVSARVADKGVISIDKLYAKGANGSTFNVYALIRGLSATPQLVAQAGIFAPVTKITPLLNKPVNVHTNKSYSVPLGVTITTAADSMKKRPVRFTSNNKAVLLGKEMSPSLTSYTDEKGYAGVTLTGGNSRADNAAVEVTCGMQKAAFTVNVLPLPTSLQLPGPADWIGKGGHIAMNAFVITLNDALNGETVVLSFLNYGEGKDVCVKKISDNSIVAEKDLSTLFVTDKNGKISLGNDDAYGIFCNSNVVEITVTASYHYEDGNYSQTQRYNVTD